MYILICLFLFIYLLLFIFICFFLFIYLFIINLFACLIFIYLFNAVRNVLGLVKYLWNPWSKVWVCGSSFAGIVVSKPAEDSCVLSSVGLYEEPFPRLGESSECVCVFVCVSLNVVRWKIILYIYPDYEGTG